MIETSPAISVIILSWNRKIDTLDAIRSALSQAIPDLEVVVIDAGSTDASADAIARDFPDVRLIRLDANLGVAGNRNVGIRNSTGEVLFFLDNDAVLKPHALAKTVEFFNSWPTIGAIGVKVVIDPGSRIDEGSWIYPFSLSNYAESTFLTYTFTGGAGAIRRSALERVGGFWEPLFFSREEEDLAFRLMEAGYDIAYVPNIEVGHKKSPAARTPPGRKLALDLRNMLWVTWRHLPILASIRLTMLRTLLYLWRGIRGGYVGDVISGLSEAIGGWPCAWRTRKPISADTYRRYSDLNPRLRVLNSSSPMLFPDQKQTAETWPRRVTMLGVDVHVLTKPDLLEEISAVCASPTRREDVFHIITLNLDILRMAVEDAAFRDVLSKATRVVADGVPIIWISRILGQPLPQRINGTDLVWDLSRLSAVSEIRLFLFGSTNQVLTESKTRIEALFPDTKIAGTWAPPMGEWSQGDNEKAIQEIQSARADVLLVALGAPKQEQWISQWAPLTGVRVAVGVGGSLDIISGRYRRAPVWAQGSGFEWLFRLMQDPARLFSRYLVQDAPTLFRAVRSALRSRLL